MSVPEMILLVGFLFIVVFGGFSLLRREGLSLRFALEALLVTGLFSGLAWYLGLNLHPILFLGVLYLVTMRVRLLVDAGNLFSRRGRYDIASRLYRLAGSAGADKSSRMIVRFNQHVLALQTGDLEGAIAGLRDLLGETTGGFLGVKHEAAAHYNLGVAYRRNGETSQAITEFNAAIDCMPSSIFAQQAEIALNQLRKSDKTGTDSNRDASG